MNLDKMTARGVFTVVVIMCVLAEITAGLIYKLF